MSNKIFNKKIALALLITLAALTSSAWQSAQAAGQAVGGKSYSWAELEQGGQPAIAARVGQSLLFCDSFADEPDCVVATTPPSRMACLSIHEVSVPGKWVRIGTVRGVTAIQGDGKNTCHGYAIPTGKWTGVNSNYVEPR